MSDREQAWGLLTEFTQSESLRKHALAVEACMRAYARKMGGDENLWGVVGLLHDFDYEKWPSLDDHPYKGNEILKERGWPDEIRRAIMSHAEYTGVTRDTPMEKTLFACDELAGFITACALVKPGKSLSEVEAKSVRKKMKDKAFARSVSRDDIVQGRGRPGHRFGRAHRVLHRSDEGRGAGTGVGWKIGLSAGQAGASVVPTARESTASSGLKATFSAAMKSASPNPQLARAYNHVKKAVFPWGLSP